jgi:hypothetical protein
VLNSSAEGDNKWINNSKATKKAFLAAVDKEISGNAAVRAIIEKVL